MNSPSIMWGQGIRFELIEQLGEGQQGRVFKALRVDRASGLTQSVAVKILHSKTAVELWKKEFESLSGVRSPYCVQVHSFERVGKRPALVLELVQGASLTDLGRTCLLSDEDIDEIVSQIQAGIQDLAAHGVFHGDLSPHNVMVDVTGRVRLLDFGLANGPDRLTPNFAAPERLTGAQSSLASDYFSLGRIELFLRGGSHSSHNESPLLRLEADRREPLVVKPDSRRQASLGRTVRLWRDRRQTVVAFGTRTQHSPRQVSWPGSALLLFAIFPLFLAGAADGPGSLRERLGFLSVRTQFWYNLRVDGSEIGFAPVSLQLVGDRDHEIAWRSAVGAGRMTVRVRPGELLVLTDRDFLHRK